MMCSSKAAVPRPRECGFTLIDMLFVIALIGLLSTLAIPGLMRARGAAQSASALGSMKVINSAQLSFAITCGVGLLLAGFADARREAAGGDRGVPAAGDDDEPRRSSRAATTSAWRAWASRRAGIVQRSAGRGRVVGLRARGGSARHQPAGALLRHERRRDYLRGCRQLLAATMPETGAPPSGQPIK